MIRKLVWGLIAILALPAFVAAGSVSFRIGYFEPRAESDLWVQNFQNLTMEKADFNGFTFMGEADYFAGDHVNVCIGVGAYEKQVKTSDREFEFEDGRPIRQTITLRIVPMEGSIKLYPAGREVPVIPYVGGGVGAYFWQYEERGDFVVNRSSNDPRLISGVFTTETVSPGYHVKAGIQIPVGRSTVDAELKYVRAKGNLSDDYDPDFEPFDLSGIQLNFGASFWF